MHIFTKRGFYHKKINEKSGDVVRGMDDGQLVVIVLADGVSTCKYGCEGATLVSSLAMDYIYKQYSLNSCMHKDWSKYMLAYVKKQLAEIVKNDKVLYDEYSSTLIAVVIDRIKSAMYYCNIGDGIIIAIDDEKCPIICMPQGGESGCPVITTEGVEKIIESGAMDISEYKSIMLCSDGTWKETFCYNRMKPSIKQMLLSGKYEEFEKYIRASNNTDDCSFALVDIRRREK